MRLFIAINFDGEVKNTLCKCVESLKKTALRGNFTHRDNLHLTLVFIGETGRTDAVKHAMDTVEAPQFVLRTGGFGRFRRGGRYICWVGVEKSASLASLYSKLCSALERNGFEIEKRELKPHVTLGRNVEVTEGFDEAGFAQSVPVQCMRVGHISLMRSERIGGRLTYTEIYRKPLE